MPPNLVLPFRWGEGHHRGYQAGRRPRPAAAKAKLVTNHITIEAFIGVKVVRMPHFLDSFVGIG